LGFGSNFVDYGVFEDRNTEFLVLDSSGTEIFCLELDFGIFVVSNADF
jgi:hypothetical protein